MKTALKQVIANLYSEYKGIMKQDVFDENDRAYFQSVNER